MLRKTGALLTNEDSRQRTVALKDEKSLFLQRRRRLRALFSCRRKTRVRVKTQFKFSFPGAQDYFLASAAVWSFPGTKRTSLQQGDKRGRAESAFMLIRQCSAI